LESVLLCSEKKVDWGLLGGDRFDSDSFAEFFEETIEVCFAGFYE